MTSRYAEGTSVSVEKSRSEIERTLSRFGATVGQWLLPQLQHAIEMGSMPSLLPGLKDERPTTRAKGTHDECC